MEGNISKPYMACRTDGSCKRNPSGNCGSNPPSSPIYSGATLYSRCEGGRATWDFINKDWELRQFPWHTNRVLTITEPGKYYSIMLFWNHASDKFLGTYVHFQLPFKKSHCGIDSLDLDLDLDIGPDLSFRWKDEDDYHQAIEAGAIPRNGCRGLRRRSLKSLKDLKNANTRSMAPG